VLKILSGSSFQVRVPLSQNDCEYGAAIFGALSHKKEMGQVVQTWPGAHDDVDGYRHGGSSMRAAHTPPLPATGKTAGRKPSKRNNRVEPLKLKPYSPIRQEGRPQALVPSDFGVEIGGRPDFDNLPRTIRDGGEKLARKLCAACH